MRDTTEILSTAVFNALNNNVVYNSVTIPVYDEKKKVDSTANVYILFSTQQEVPQDTFSNHITDSFMDLEICHKSGSEVSKSTLSGVANAVLTILFPDRQTQGITSPDSDFRIDTLEFAGSITRVLEISPTESVLRKFIKLKATIVQS